MTYTCLKCNKSFKFKSKLESHEKRTTDCKKTNKSYNCLLCNSNFKYESDFLRHEKTKKHIINVHNSINGNNNQLQNTIYGDNNINNYNNIIHLTLNTNSFVNTDLTYVGMGAINDVGNIYLDAMENKKITNEEDRVILLFDEVVYIINKFHFNIGAEENHNLKILLVFPAIAKSVYENLILEIDNTTKKITWKSVDYKTLIEHILEHLLSLNIRFNNKNYNDFINYLKSHLLNDSEEAMKLQPIINKKLSQMYIDFNTKQDKPEREVKFTFDEKLDEYLSYRTQECTLGNGFTPEIINSKFKKIINNN